MNNLSFMRVDLERLEVLRAFAERTFREAWQDDNDPDDFEAYCRKHFAADYLATELEQPGSEFYLFDMESQVVAYLKLNINCRPLHDWDGSPALQLERIYVLKGVQSKGLGAELLGFTENRARETGAEWVWLSVWQKSPRTISFYEKNGFSIFGVETFWVGDDPQPDWLMKKRVA
ncbi:MAG: GNAT family N-acetyltransferase [Lewinellaceae bacterium]|jgi:GNAT superfamily N-acetyltransferase|nr:GNAT family N-acetyltransferase [Lewinellaceae bacterium]